MRKLYTIEVILLIYLLMCMIGFSGGNSNFWKSYYFIREHGFIVALILAPKNYFVTVFSTLLSWGVVIFKAELIIFNIVLIFLSKDLYNYYTWWYYFVVILSYSIWLVIFISIFFDKIIIILTKCLKIIKDDRIS